MAAATFLIYYSTTRCHVVCLFVFGFYQSGNIAYCLVVVVVVFMLVWSFLSCPDYQSVEVCFFFRRVSSTTFAMSPQEQGIIFGTASQAHVSIQFEDRQGATAKDLCVQRLDWKWT